jgi:hypothetical protein
VWPISITIITQPERQARLLTTTVAALGYFTVVGKSSIKQTLEVLLGIRRPALAKVSTLCLGAVEESNDVGAVQLAL